MILHLLGDFEEIVDLLSDGLLLLQAVLKDVEGAFEVRFRLRDRLELHLGITIHDVLVEFQGVHGLFAALGEHPLSEAGVGRLLEPCGHAQVHVAGGHFVVDLFVEKLGEFGAESHGNWVRLRSD